MKDGVRAGGDVGVLGGIGARGGIGGRGERVAAVLIVGVVGGLLATTIWIHRDLGGADAFAYWKAVHTWLAGGDAYHPAGTWWPWAYAPWLLPTLLPWALLPWPFAWATWQVVEYLLLAATFAWAYRRRALATALAWLLLAIPIGLTLDSGNVTLLCAFALWAAQLVEGRAGGFLWALAAAVKWYPALFWPLLERRARATGLGLAAVAAVLTLATWPQTLAQLGVVATTGVPQPGSLFNLRIDHLAILWALVPWLWRRRAYGQRRRTTSSASIGPRPGGGTRRIVSARSTTT